MKTLTRASDLSPLAGGVFVPTMGALHEGHAALIRAARAEADRRGGQVVVSIFVNPTQFNDPTDFQRYPRTLGADEAVCRDAGADVVFAPEVEEMYPDRPAPAPPLPEVARRPGLEDAARPGHFAGVCQVVKRLFELVRPRAAIFGEKDWQQLQVVRAMASQEGMGVGVIGMPTVRDPDGLAMSSRNRFLSASDRESALAISRALRSAQREREPVAAERAMRAELDAAGIGGGVEYAVVRDAATLLAFTQGRPGRALIAARVGPVRLIDNAAWQGPGRGDAAAGPGR